MPKSILEVVHLTKHFLINGKRLQAINNVSFNVKPGEVLGLVGESGCGKSTLAKLMVRLIKPTSGHIQFDGTDINQLNSHALKAWRQRMQMIFQNPTSALNPKMTIEKILAEPLDIHKLATGSARLTRLQELLDLVGLNSSLLKRLPEELSGGQRQRVGIARALAVQPDFLICDESLSSLDVSTQAQIVQLLKQLQHELQLTFLFISHDLSLVSHIADRVAVMYLGKLMELSSSQELYKNPLHPYTQGLLSAIPLPNPKAERQRNRVVLKGEIPSPFNPPTGCPFHTRCPLAAPICRQIAPEWEEINSGHYVACHFKKLS